MCRLDACTTRRFLDGDVGLHGDAIRRKVGARSPDAEGDGEGALTVVGVGGILLVGGRAIAEVPEPLVGLAAGR